ncbi:hypothetical protein [Sphingopyxis sp. LK2115]|uniref:hypothetical protein n=1 Tax=Sphingopyxis sp. LK2115 TaxID=2744558 RepID=UPI0016611B78|nr:hypothetical protein [Sphingopyxis sp. LK2115]
MRVTFNKEARDRYLRFAEDPGSRWRGNFRDLAASVTRMATLSQTGRIDVDTVALEASRLNSLWAGDKKVGDGLEALLSPDQLAQIDPFDRVQLAYVVGICRSCGSLSAAGRQLFASSREQRTSTNDADRLRKYLARFDLDWISVTGK